jgi:hypothetical protein
MAILLKVWGKILKPGAAKRKQVPRANRLRITAPADRIKPVQPSFRISQNELFERSGNGFTLSENRRNAERRSHRPSSSHSERQSPIPFVRRSFGANGQSEIQGFERRD